MPSIVRRVRASVLFLILVVLIGTVGIHSIGEGRWSWGQSVYHTIISISTVGFGELPGMENIPLARFYTVVMIVFGAGSVVYFLSVSTALLVEGELRDFFKQRTMKRSIDDLKNHIIVCGIGRTGAHVVAELHATHTPFVVIDIDPAKIEWLREHLHDEHLCGLVGDATEDEVLKNAGVERARGLVAALDDDKANLFATLSARSLNHEMRIIAKCIDATAEPKLRRVGADKVVATNVIGGMRLASEMIRPSVTEFLDQMLRDPEHVLRIEEARVSATSRVAGQTLAAASLRKVCDVLVVAVRTAEGRHRFNPGADTVLEVGATLIVLGERGEIAKLREAIGANP
ncbi:MAG: potassium channel protein [Myxococcales bacterium]|nr:potassium channel protein [Myxococcales bacterium]